MAWIFVITSLAWGQIGMAKFEIDDENRVEAIAARENEIRKEFDRDQKRKDWPDADFASVVGLLCNFEQVKSPEGIKSSKEGKESGFELVKASLDVKTFDKILNQNKFTQEDFTKLVEKRILSLQKSLTKNETSKEALQWQISVLQTFGKRINKESAVADKNILRSRELNEIELEKNPRSIAKILDLSAFKFPTLVLDKSEFSEKEETQNLNSGEGAKPWRAVGIQNKIEGWYHSLGCESVPRTDPDYQHRETWGLSQTAFDMESAIAIRTTKLLPAKNRQRRELFKDTLNKVFEKPSVNLSATDKLDTALEMFKHFKLVEMDKTGPNGEQFKVGMVTLEDFQIPGESHILVTQDDFGEVRTYKLVEDGAETRFEEFSIEDTNLQFEEEPVENSDNTN